jgi:hypothetical protein
MRFTLRPKEFQCPFNTPLLSKSWRGPQIVSKSSKSHRVIPMGILFWNPQLRSSHSHPLRYGLEAQREDSQHVNQASFAARLCGGLLERTRSAQGRNRSSEQSRSHPSGSSPFTVDHSRNRGQRVHATTGKKRETARGSFSVHVNSGSGEVKQP